MEATQLIRDGFANAKRVTDKTIDGLTSAELSWQPKPGANSIGLILFHMFRSEDSFVQYLIQKKSPIWVSDEWCEKLSKPPTDSGSHYTAEQIDTFQLPSLEDLIAYGKAVREKTLEFVDSLTDAQLDAAVELPPIPHASGQGTPPRRPFEPFVGSLLIMTVTHQAQHAGEISYLRGLDK